MKSPLGVVEYHCCLITGLGIPFPVQNNDKGTIIRDRVSGRLFCADETCQNSEQNGGKNDNG